MVQNINFLPVNQNSDLSLKLNPNRQHESISMLGFENRAPNIKILKFHANWDNSAYLENKIFNGSSFVNSKTVIGFMVLKLRLTIYVIVSCSGHTIMTRHDNTLTRTLSINKCVKNLNPNTTRLINV